MPVIPGRISTSQFSLSEEQQRAVQHLLSNVRTKQVQVLSGYAGTGKTVCCKELSKRLLGWAVATYTGKASDVLRRKGVNSQTIHSLIYAINKPGMEGYVEGEPEWRLKKSWEVGVEGFLIDEGSMVPESIHNDLLTFEVPIIYIGDGGQLEPIGDSKFNIMELSDITLEKIHRNAGEIAHFAEFIRNGGCPTDWQNRDEYNPETSLITFDSWNNQPNGVWLADQILCAKNATRVVANKYMRKLLEYPIQPVVGDRVIILQNNREKAVFNGMQGEITQIFGYDRIQIESNGCNYNLRIRPDVFNNEKPQLKYDKYSVPVDYAYCCTVHKCVHPDTLTETTSGLLPISKIGKEGIVATPFGSSNYHTFITNPIGPALRLVFKGGYEITVTPEHKLDVWRNGHYVQIQAKNMVIGDISRLKLGVTIDPTTEVLLPGNPEVDIRASKYKLPRMSEELAEFLGLMVADGHIRNREFHLAKRHLDVVERFEYLVTTLFGCKSRRYEIYGTAACEVCSTFLSSWLTKLGGMNVENKDVPECILRSTSNIQAAFLRGLFEDGTVNTKDRSIEWYSIYPKLRNKVRVMLLRLGITVGETLNREGSIYLYSSNVSRFMANIGFVASSKNAIALNSPKEESPRSSQIPVTKDFIRGAKPYLPTYIYQNAMFREHLSRESLEYLTGIRVDRRTKRDVKEMMEFHHVPLRLIEPTTCESMCIEVPNGHKFLQNGIVGSNSQGSEYDSISVIEERLPYSDHKRWCYTAASRAKEKILWITL